MNKIEKALTGSLIMYPNKFLSIAGVVKAEDIQDPEAQKAFSIAKKLWQGKKKVDPITVFAEDNTLSTFLAEVVDMASPAGITDYAWRVAGCAKSRRIDNGLEAICKEPAPSSEKLSKIMSLYNDEISLVRKDVKFEKALQRFNKIKIQGVSTGFDFLDEKYIQYIPGHIWTMGGFTSTGKTAVMIQKICNLLNSEENPSIKVISTEMTEEQLIARLLSNYTGIHSQRILMKKFYKGEEEVVSEIQNTIKHKNLTIHDDIYTLGDIEAEFRRADLQGGIDVGFIDYVQNCSVPEAKSEYQEGAMLAKGLQRLAKSARATLICLSQVSNSVGRGDSSQLEMKGAGEWAAVSDVSVRLTKGKQNACALLYEIAKNRHGQLHRHIMEYKLNYTRIEAIREDNPDIKSKQTS